jgi:hypothetical protein
VTYREAHEILLYVALNGPEGYAPETLRTAEETMAEYRGERTATPTTHIFPGVI